MTHSSKIGFQKKSFAVLVCETFCKSVFIQIISIGRSIVYSIFCIALFKRGFSSKCVFAVSCYETVFNNSFGSAVSIGKFHFLKHSSNNGLAMK